MFETGILKYYFFCFTTIFKFNKFRNSFIIHLYNKSYMNKFLLLLFTLLFLQSCAGSGVVSFGIPF